MPESVCYNKPKMPVWVIAVLFVTIFLYLTFPKSGIKIQGIPIAAQDILFFILILFSLIKVTYWSQVWNRNKTITALIIIFAVYVAVKVGYSYWHSNLLDIEIIVVWLVYPLIFWLLLCLDQIYELPWKGLLLIPVAAFIIVSVYALLQLVLGIENVMIPGLTYNWTDAQDPTIFFVKNNYYGSYTKIFSTYQNGNIFGVNLLLLFPLVFELLYDRKKYWGYLGLVLFIIVALLTASRAVWIGVLCYILLRFLFFPTGRRRIMVLLPISLMSSLILFTDFLRYRANMFLGKGVLPKIFDIPVVGSWALNASQGSQAWKQIDNTPQIKNLAHRAGGLHKLWEATFGSINGGAILFGAYGLLPGNSYNIPGEMVYAAIFGYLGLIGLVLWFLPMGFSLFRFFQKREDFIVRGVLLALASYFITAAAEGAYWLSPTAFTLWLIIGIGWLRVKRIDPAT